jgi:hypothetical protein
MELGMLRSRHVTSVTKEQTLDVTYGRGRISAPHIVSNKGMN